MKCRVYPIERVRRRTTLLLEDGALQIPIALAQPLWIDKPTGLPPRRVAREHARRLDSRPFVDWGKELLGCAEWDQPNASEG